MAQNRNGIYGRGHFIRVHHALLNAPAFICLSGTARQVLIDFSGYYDRASDYDTKRSWWKFGIRYTFSMCRFSISRTSFYNALEQLQTKGFIQPHGEDLQSGQPASWLPCERWRKYTPGQAELRLLRTFVKKRGRCAENPAQITFDFPDVKTPSRPDAPEPEIRQAPLAARPAVAGLVGTAAAGQPIRVGDLIPSRFQRKAQ